MTVAEYDALRAEVERLRDALRAKDGANHLLVQEIERLRKGADETVDTKPICQETGMAQALMRASRASAADLVLDHRLGTQQIYR